ncbi:MAG: HAD family phosphatase [Planctomycetota bacterium]
MVFDDFLFTDSLLNLETGGDGRFKVGRNGVSKILAPFDRKVEFICSDDGQVMAFVQSSMGYPALYPFLPARIDRPVQAVLMDLDGTSIQSEDFWIWIIELTTAKLLDDPKFSFAEEDLPHVSGHVFSEHLQYCIQKYCPDRSIHQAREYYFEIAHYQMQEIMQGRGRVGAFNPMPGLKDFLLTLKDKGIKIGLVTSGLYEKAWPEILSAFRQLDMGDPHDFYDAIITAGYAIRKDQAGTLGQLESKPHPWLYAEAASVGLGIEFDQRSTVIGIEDSGAGVIASRLAGFATIGMAGGNIEESGTLPLCSAYCRSFEQILQDIVE